MGQEVAAIDVRGRLATAPMGRLCLTFDHRVSDGAPAAEFLQTVKGLLEEPALARLAEAESAGFEAWQAARSAAE